MNRSIFQTIKDKWFYNLTIIIIFYFLLNWNLNISCFSIRNTPDILLKEIKYKNLIFKCSVEIPTEIACQSIDNFFLNKPNVINFNIIKYYKIENSIALPLPPNSCYAHPNLFIGTFNNLHWNLQFSHSIFNKNFSHISDQDIFFSPRNQYISNQLYIYDSIFKQQFLNFDNLNENNLEIYKNNKFNFIQEYINKNNFEFNNIVNKALKI